MSLENTTSTLSDGYTVIPVGKNEHRYDSFEEENESVMIMDMNILRNSGVTHLRPLHKPNNGLYKDSNTESDEENPEPKPLKRFFWQRFQWYQRFADFYAIPRFRKRINDVLLVIIIGIIAGSLAVLAEANLNNRTSNDNYLVHRLDRLIRAVELDWGR